MKTLIYILVVFTVLQAESIAQEIRFSPWPMGARDQSIYDNKPLAEYLSKRLNRPVRIVYFEKYERVMEEFKNGNIDLITIGPNPFIKLRQDYPDTLGIAHIKDEKGSALYTCSVVVRKTGPNSIKAIKGTLGLCQGLCTCGRFFAKYVLKSVGKDIRTFETKEFLFHNDVIEALIRGDVEAAFLRTDVVRKYLGYNVKVIYTSPLLPNRIVAANKRTLDNEVIAKVKKILLEISPTTHPFLGIYKYGFAEFNEESLKVLEQMK